jgi:DNA-directed RNA polymerase specialized sigma24 family protein
LETDSGQATQLLKAMRAGDPQAAQDLLPLVYAELHRLARSYMRRERPDHTLHATALINEAYICSWRERRLTGKTAPISLVCRPR